MVEGSLVDTSRSSRELFQTLRRGFGDLTEGAMPESHAWHVFLELRRRGEPDATAMFLSTLRALLSRRAMGAVAVPSEDLYPEEHKATEDPFLSDLWKAYKKCIRGNRTGPAAQLLRDIEEQLLKN